MVLRVPLWTTNLAGRDSTSPPELHPLLLPNPPLHPLLLLHPTDLRRQRPHKATPTLIILSPFNLHSRSNPSNLLSTHNPPITMTLTPTPAGPIRTTLDRTHRTHTSLPSPLSTSHLNSSTRPSSRCRPAAALDRLHRLRMRHYRHRLEVNSTVVLTILHYHLHQNARTSVVGTTLHRSKISALRVGTSTNQLRLLRLSRTLWGRLGLHLAHLRTPTRARVRRSPLHRGQAASILAPLHRHKTGCSPRCNLDPGHTVLLPCPTVYRRPSRCHLNHMDPSFVNLRTNSLLPRLPHTSALDPHLHRLDHLPQVHMAVEPPLPGYTDHHLPSRGHPPISRRHRIGLVLHPTKLGLLNLYTNLLRVHHDPVLLPLEIIHHPNPGYKRDPLLQSIVSIGCCNIFPPELILIAAPGDRSHIPEHLRSIYEIISEHLNHLKQTTPVSCHSITECGGRTLKMSGSQFSHNRSAW